MYYHILFIFLLELCIIISCSFFFFNYVLSYPVHFSSSTVYYLILNIAEYKPLIYTQFWCLVLILHEHSILLTFALSFFLFCKISRLKLYQNSLLKLCNLSLYMWNCLNVLCIYSLLLTISDLLWFFCTLPELCACTSPVLCASTLTGLCAYAARTYCLHAIRTLCMYAGRTFHPLAIRTLLQASSVQRCSFHLDFFQFFVRGMAIYLIREEKTFIIVWVIHHLTIQMHKEPSYEWPTPSNLLWLQHLFRRLHLWQARCTISL